MTKKNQQYILIDDDSTSNLIGEFVIKKFDPTAKISSFLDPEVALTEIQRRYDGCSKHEICIFLDLNMPRMTGWEFLEVFQQLEEQVKNCFIIYVLTSSMEDFSGEKKKFPFVAGFISKPLKKDKLEQIFANLSKEKEI